MTWFKKSFYVLTMIAIATMVSGCSKKNPTGSAISNKIVVWSFEDPDYWKTTLEDIKNGQIPELQGYEIEYVKKSLTSSYENDALNSMLSGQGPDVWAIPSDWVPRHKDKLYPAPAGTPINKDLYASAVVQNNFIEEKIYGFSAFVDPLVVFYNTDLLDAYIREFSAQNPPPKIPSRMNKDEYSELPEVKAYLNEYNFRSNIPDNWEDLISWTEKYTRRSGEGISRSAIALGSTNNVTYSAEILYNMMMQNGIKMVNDNNDLATFNQSINDASGNQVYPGKYAFELFNRFSDPKQATYTWNGNQQKDIDAFIGGQVLMIIAPNSLSTKLSLENPNLKFDKSLVPKIKNSEESQIYYARSVSFVVPNISMLPVQAWNLATLGFSNIYGSVGAVKISDEQEADYTSSKEFEKYLPQIAAKYSHNWNKGRYPDNVSRIFKTSFEDYKNGKIDSQGALDSAATKVTELLKKEDW
jgi:ABC-type glycerol-3-phosphate transport system substrate-binding protein